MNRKENRMDTLNNYINKDLLFLDLEVNSQEDLLRYMAKELNRRENVNEEFIKKVIEREKEFPTGLQIEEIGVAIPHSDIEHVNEPAVALAVLKNPINFYSMEDGKKIIPINVVFMLAVDDGNKQLKLLQEIMGLIQSKETLKNIIEADTKEEILELIAS
ncbi:MAG: PTS sugar transporter subunit IIA [Tetragenococcus koreensis]|nr:PTS sugar transporter subunit IIA [Tetragenococcus koreensis]